MSQKNLISSIVIAKNEESRIAGCLAALSWTDERIVVDNGSTDQTSRIAQDAGARVVELQDGDFSALRNAGARAASGVWLLYVDADEIVTKELASEIREVIHRSSPPAGEAGSVASYKIKRRNYYLGREWPHQDEHVRLFRKNALQGWQGVLHESPTVKGATAALIQPLLHNTHRTLSEMVAKTNEWSQVEARLRINAAHPPVTPWRLWRVCVTAFFNSYVREGGWRAGTVGWIESIYQAFSIFITYAKLWELQNKQ